ncbi:hypothetical protein P168DRAFT_323788 [Aspergillus campestris IBT 28561]|uniref:GPI anchored protein n=1 Tax=Aspergillus campestris (strain IBT 28561) TaxID=1392248 RepID=A0A2I1DFS6_ASPC2|nr:uncharacterized protein P168DRAFT_323788 [Aspergillus campestris IBT 28561]PKY08711.1 hypothetical protein P168DRAFT_323788 [Aspergillus campestris IBT 28561]
MRSGLQKPVAVPFLALLVFSLFSLVPSLAKEWDLYSFRFGYLGYRRPDAHRPTDVPRVSDALVDVQPLLRTDNGQSKSYLERADQPLLDRKSRPRRTTLDSLAENLIETAPVLDGPITRPVEQPSSLVRGVRAFRSLVYKQVDEQIPIPQPSLLDSSGKTDPAPYTPTVDLPVTPATPAVVGSFEKGYTRGLTHEINLTESRFSFPFNATWQRACYLVHHLQTFFASPELLNKKPPTSYPTTSHPKEHVPAQFPSHDYVLSEGNCSQASPAKVHNIVLPETIPHVNLTAKPAHIPERAAAEAQAATLDRDPERLRGSCMAIVISIVVGVVWF